MLEERKINLENVTPETDVTRSNVMEILTPPWLYGGVTA